MYVALFRKNNITVEKYLGFANEPSAQCVSFLNKWCSISGFGHEVLKC